MTTRRRLVYVCCVALCACARPAPRAPAPEFIRATAIVEHSPSIVEPSAESTRSGEESIFDEPIDDGAAQVVLAPSPPLLPATSPSEPPRSPRELIAEANALATRTPEPSAFVGAVAQYVYEPGAVYKIFTTPFRMTNVWLEPGEQIIGTPMGGDVVRWRVELGTSGSEGVPQPMLFVQPTRAGLRTNITVTTDRRTYLLDVESLDETFMVGVQWTYATRAAVALPVAIRPDASAAGAAGASAQTDLSELCFDYAVEVVSGHPPWTPRAVYDDGTKTFLRFDGALLTGEAPVLYVIERDEAQIVNYRVHGTLYIVDRIFERAELRLGKDDQDVVRIRRRARASTAAAARKRATTPSPARFPVTPAPRH